MNCVRTLFLFKIYLWAPFLNKIPKFLISTNGKMRWMEGWQASSRVGMHRLQHPSQSGELTSPDSVGRWGTRQLSVCDTYQTTVQLNSTFSILICPRFPSWYLPPCSYVTLYPRGPWFKSRPQDWLSCFMILVNGRSFSMWILWYNFRICYDHFVWSPQHWRVLFALLDDNAVLCRP